MSYKFTKGSQIIGDLKAADDTQRDTKIDFGEDYIGLETSGSVRMVISGSDGKVGIGTNTPDYTLDVAGDIGVNQYIYHNGDANTWINFTDNRIRLNAGGNNFIDCEDPGSAPHKVRINNGGNNIDFVIKDNSNNVYFTADASAAKIGIGTDTPSHKLDVNGDIRVRGNDIRDNSGNPAVTFDGSANTTVVNNLTVQNYTFPSTDGSANQVLQTNGSGQLSFVDVDDGGGGGSSTPEVLKVGLSSDFTLSGSGTYQTLSLSGVQFDTFTGGAGWNTGSYSFVAKEEGYYEFQASFIYDVIQNDITQYQIYLVSSSSASSFSQANIPFLALNQYNNNPAEIDMRTFHLSTIAHFSVNQSASIQVRQIGGTGNQTKIKQGLNQTFLTIRKL